MGRVGHERRWCLQARCDHLPNAKKGECASCPYWVLARLERYFSVTDRRKNWWWFRDRRPLLCDHGLKYSTRNSSVWHQAFVSSFACSLFLCILPSSCSSRRGVGGAGEQIGRFQDWEMRDGDLEKQSHSSQPGLGLCWGGLGLPCRPAPSAPSCLLPACAWLPPLPPAPPETVSRGGIDDANLRKGADATDSETVHVTLTKHALPPPTPSPAPLPLPSLPTPPSRPVKHRQTPDL